MQSTMDPKSNGRLLAIGEKMHNEREQQLREISDLKNAKEELRSAIEKIGIICKLSWTHPSEVASHVDSMAMQLRNARAARDGLRDVLQKIFRMAGGVGNSQDPDDVIAAVFKITQAGASGRVEEFRQQLEAETQANIELRKELEAEKQRTKFARDAISGFKEEAQIAQQTAKHWKDQTGTTEAALRKITEQSESQLGLRKKVEKLEGQLKGAMDQAAQLEKECQRHRGDVARNAERLGESQEIVIRLQDEVLELKAKLRAPVVAAKAGNGQAKYRSLRVAVMNALRSGMKLVKEGGVSEENSARYNKAFNAGLRAGASIVEIEVYSAIPPEENE